MNRKNVEYLVAGALALYVVFLTRPAPALVVNLLSSTVAQVAALAAVIYVGATQSLLVAVVLALAVVMSIPSREHMTEADKKKLDKKPSAAPPKKAPVPHKKPAAAPANKEMFEHDKTVPEEPAPGGSAIASAASAEPTGNGSEKFTLQNAAPF